jgi:hypothetical protein
VESVYIPSRIKRKLVILYFLGLFRKKSSIVEGSFVNGKIFIISTIKSNNQIIIFSIFNSSLHALLRLALDAVILLFSHISIPDFVKILFFAHQQVLVWRHFCYIECRP